MTEAQFNLGDIAVEVALKNIRSLRLIVSAPDGRVRISAPRRVKLDVIRAFALSKLEWIRRQQARIQAQGHATRRDYVDGETHPVWGADHVLTVSEGTRRATVALAEGRILLRVPTGAGREKRQAVLDHWYRQQLALALPPVLALWQERMGVRVERIFVRRMRTRWGSCTPRTGTIRFNAELAKRPAAALEYIVVHELVHLLEPSHNARFVALMDRFLPDWKLQRKALHRRSP